MKKSLKLIVLSFLLLLSLNTFAGSKLADAVDNANKQIEIRKSRIENNLRKFDRLRIEPRLKALRKPGAVAVASDPGALLKCNRKIFNWAGKKNGYEYEDCEFTLDISNQADVVAMYSTLGRRKDNGWTVVKSEIHKQNVLSPNKIITVQRFRFEKPIP